MDPRLASVRARLDRLRELDPRLPVAAPPLTADRLSELEATLGVTLPEELAAFLTNVHGGGPGPGDGLHLAEPARWDDEDTEALRSWRITKRRTPFPFGDADAASLDARRRGGDHTASFPPAGEPDDDLPPGPGFVVLSSTGHGATEVVVVTGEQRGKVWISDMTWWTWPGNLGFLDWYELWLDGALAGHQPEPPPEPPPGLPPPVEGPTGEVARIAAWWRGGRSGPPR